MQNKCKLDSGCLDTSGCACSKSSGSLCCQAELTPVSQSLIFRLRRRAQIRRQISTRKSVEQGIPDRLADLLEEAATALELSKSEWTVLPLENDNIAYDATIHPAVQSDEYSYRLVSQKVLVKRKNGEITFAYMETTDPMDDPEENKLVYWYSDCSEKWDITSQVVAWKYFKD